MVAHPLRLHVPEPPARPGEAPDFSKLGITAARNPARPPVTAPAAELAGHAHGLIRVLDDEGVAGGQWNPGLSAEVLQGGLRAMVLTRALDERMVRQQRQGRTSFYIKSTGEEAVAVAAAMALAPDDMLFPSYRQQGLLVSRGWPIVEMVCQVFGNSRDRLKGRQMPVMYSARDVGVFSLSGNLGTQFPQAVGWAMASAISGDTRIAASWIGDGTTAEADFHYAMTFASVYRVPVLLNVVNNQWAISSFQGIAGGENATFAQRAIGYGLPGLRVDGNDFLAVHAATQWAAMRARENHGATLLEMFTYRADAHSTSDDPSGYRPKGEASSWPLGDPIERLKRHLLVLGAWTESRHNQLLEECDLQVRDAIREAERSGTLGSSAGDPGSMFEDVFEVMPPHLARQREQMERR